MNDFKDTLKFVRDNPYTWAVVVILFGVMSTAMLMLSQAASGTWSFEAEGGDLAGDAANVVNIQPGDYSNGYVALNGNVPVPSVTPPPPSNPVTFVGAGDIAKCSLQEDEATATLLDSIEGTVFTAGDNAYESGTVREYADCYNPTWGRHKSRTKPVPGNHEYNSSAAAGYYAYFGAAAGDPNKGYYSYDVGQWHILALNSNCDSIGGCQTGSPQEAWVRADLAAHPSICTAAYWHHPVFSSGDHGNSDRMLDIWRILDEAGVDVVISGHDHNYERFAAQNAAGAADSAGIVSFIVGTGGTSLRPMKTAKPNSVISNATTHGVIKFSLYADKADYEFVPIAGKTFTDSGTISCQ